MSASRQPPKTVRCAVYTRKSTEEGLDQAFNSLDAQREAGEAYIASQKSEGWVCLPERYDDGGFTGGNMERPALKRLMDEIEAGRVNMLVVYKVDRLSRSLMDFARIMEVLDRRQVAFVSVTQQFNTGTSMGRLILNVLLSFAQFEREMISERTRDKMAATRRKGRWTGGTLVLGYDLVPGGGRIVVNEDEAQQVRELFRTFIESESLVHTVVEAAKRGWVNKGWVTRDGRPHPGRKFDKLSMRRLLRNPIYIGQIRYKDEIYPGEHPAIISQETFERAGRLMFHNPNSRGMQASNKFGALFKGLICCAHCNCRMITTYSGGKGGNKIHRYYLCGSAARFGWQVCPSPMIPAADIERFVVEQVRGVVQSQGLITETLAASRRGCVETIGRLQTERETLESELGRVLRELDAQPAQDDPAWREDLEKRLEQDRQRLATIGRETKALQSRPIGREEVAEAVSAFDPLWESLPSIERIRLTHLLVRQVNFDGARKTVAISFHAAGLKALASKEGASA